MEKVVLVTETDYRLSNLFLLILTMVNENYQQTLLYTHPCVAAKWHPYRNGALTPDMVTSKQSKKVWWFFSYDDPDTGRHFDFEWSARIHNVVKYTFECPFLAGKAVWKGFNDLQTKRPDVAKRWHPSKNGALTPDMVTPNSVKRVWWFFPYDDPDTGRHFDFEWPANIRNVVSNDSECPFLTGRAVWKGFNDLQTKRPDVAKRWHPSKNGALTPDMVTPTQAKTVWWFFPYDDPDTGRHFDFEWSARIFQAANYVFECPFLTGRSVWKGFNDLQTKRPDIAAKWHPSRNGTLTPDMVTPNSKKTVWWFFPYDDPNTGCHFDFEWPAPIVNVTTSAFACPFLTGRTVWKGFNDLQTKRPDIAAKWHPSRNGTLSPDMVTFKSNKTVWWFFPYDDPDTGRHFDFEWRAKIYYVVNYAFECPFLTGKAVWKGFNDLQTKRPDIAKRWHPSRNGTLSPDMVTPYSGKTVWWFFPYDDPDTGRHFDFEWPAPIVNVTTSAFACPFLTNSHVWKGFNDLATKYPDITLYWDYQKNTLKQPDTVFYKSFKKYWWICPKCHKSFKRSIFQRISYSPFCQSCK